MALILPLVFGPSLFVTPYILVKTLTFFTGFIFFGDPLISRGLAWLDRTVPGWQKLLEPRKYVPFSGPNPHLLAIVDPS